VVVVFREGLVELAALVATSHLLGATRGALGKPTNLARNRTLNHVAAAEREVETEIARLVERLFGGSRAD